MNTVVKRSCLILLLMSLLALPAMAQVARMQFIHSSGDIDGRIVDIYVNDVLVVDNLNFRTATAFKDVPAGTVNFKVTPSTQLPADSIIVELNATLNAGVAYVGIAGGITPTNLTTPPKYSNPFNRKITFTVFAVPNARETASNAAKVEFFAFHGSTDAPPVDVLVAGVTTPLVDNLDYGQSTSYLAVDPAMYTLDVTSSDDNTNIIGSFEADLTALAGKSAVVFASGFLTPANNQSAAALGLFAALADGQVLTFRSLFVGPIGKWKFAGQSEFQFKDFLGADTLSRSGHGVAVDKQNRIWVANNAPNATLPVINPDGTPADISPIRTLTVGTETFNTGASRGITVDNEGRIIFARGSRLFRIEPVFGTATDMWVGTASLLDPMVDKDGFIWTGLVSGINPVSLIDPNTFQESQQITLSKPPGFGRGIGITADATTIFTPDLGNDGGPVYLWTTSDFTNYVKTDSIYTNADRELIMTAHRITFDWHPIDSTLWISVDKAYDVTDNSRNALFSFDFKTLEYKILPMPEIGPGIGNGPRGVAFSVSGDTAYVVCFNGNRLMRFVRGGVGVKDRPLAGIPAHYELLQNYPNPFNPSTTIPFTLSQFAQVELKIYDGLGRVVKTLVKQVMPPGRHEVVFDGANLASGPYHYRLYVDGRVLTRNMLLLK